MNALFLTLPITLMALAPSDPTQAQEAAMFSAGTTWQVSAINGEDFEGTATLTFAEDGQISGKAVCNNYTGSLSGDAELFQIGPMAVTKMACPDMAAEDAFLKALGAMTKGEETDGILTLRGTGDAEMTFTPSAS